MTDIERVKQIIKDGGSCLGTACRECPLYAYQGETSCFEDEETLERAKQYLKEHEMKRGDRVLCWDIAGQEKSLRIYLANVGGEYPHVVVAVETEQLYPDGDYLSVEYKHAEPMPQPEEMTLEEVCKELGRDIKIKKG